MPATLEIREFPDGVFVRCTEPRRIVPILLAFSCGMVITFICIRFTSASVVRWCIGVAGSVLLARSVAGALRPTNVVLRVNELDMITTGRGPESFKPGRIPRAEISSMEFRRTGRGDLTEGLYVEHRTADGSDETCVLPCIDEGQVQRVLEAIYRRFPEMGSPMANG